MTSLGLGGGERVSVDLMNILAEKGHQVFLIVMEYEGLYKESISSRVVVHDLHTKKISYAFFKFFTLLIKIKPKTIFASSVHLNVLVIFAKIISFSNMKVIIRIGSPFSLLFQEYKSFKDKYILFRLTKWLYKYASTIICVAECVKKDLQTFVSVLPERLVVMYSPKNREEIIQKSQEQQPVIFREKEGPFFLYVGRLTSAKDPGTLLEAFNLFKRDGHKGTLLFIGNGGLRDSLEEKTKHYSLDNSVVFLGAQKNPYTYMKHATCVVLSSTSEGLPNVLLEALILEKPVVATDCFPGGAREVMLGKIEQINKIEENSLGIMVPVRDPQTLKDALVRITEKSDLDPHLPPQFNGSYQGVFDIF